MEKTFEYLNKKCLNCRTEITEDNCLNPLTYITEILCDECSDEIRDSIYNIVVVRFPKLVEKIESEYNRQYIGTFKEYYESKVRHRVYKLYIDRVVKKAYGQKRRDILGLLPRDFTRREIAKLRKEAKCALTGSTANITLDHFIPLEWGHGGEYTGNIYFVTRKLNGSKSKQNPFKWIEKVTEIKKITNTENIIMSKWDELIDKLAKENELSVNEFRLFVNWCDDNRRSLDDLKLDNRHSLEIWKSINI